MLRNRAVALILGIIASPLVIALGLGPLQSDSALNEPFSGRIDLLGATAEDFDALRIGLASLEQFDRAGIELNPLLYKLKFAIDDNPAGADFVSITSKDPIREPYLNFLVEMNWANGRLVREYTVLLDPPLYDPNPRRVAEAPPAAAPAADSQPSSPAPTEIAPVPTPAPALSSAPYSTGGEIGPVQSNDTLWSIASRVRPNEAVTVQQMMLALLRENPDAFTDNNINLLRRGAILRMPDDAALSAYSARDAFAEAQRQHQLWEEYRNQVSAEPAVQPVGAPAPSMGTETLLPRPSDSRLELVAPGGPDVGSTPGKATEGGSDLLREEIDARAQANADLSGKLTEAEEIIDLLQRQVNIKDEELAALQARLAELGIEHGDVALPDVDSALQTDMVDLETDDELAAPADGTGIEQDGDEPDALEPEVSLADDAAPADDGPTETLAADDTAEAEIELPSAIEVDDAVPERGFPYSLVPEQIAAMVPGGALTVLGGIAAAILGLFALVVNFLMKSRAEGPAQVSTPEPALVEPTADADDGSEDPTVTASTDVPDTSTDVPDISEDVTEVGAEVPAAAFDPNATVEAEAAETESTVEVPAAAAEDESDPLEEINVYLAYERFDQAEELVKRVIGEYPDRHEYRLRLLEVYYSSNDRAAYEASARELLDAVGEGDPLWDSAVAMWSEMSPDRELFAEGGDVESVAEQDSASAFVDITAELNEAEAGQETLAQAPGGDLDFDLAGGDDADIDLESTVATLGTGAADEDVLDVTGAQDDADAVFDIAGGEGDGGALDVTVSDDADETELDLDGDVLDVTASADEDILDISGGISDTLLDISAEQAGSDLLDLTGGGDSGGDMLDVTQTGDAGLFDDADLLNVTSPGLRGDDDAEAPGDDAQASAADADLEITDVTGGAEEALDFNLSDTVAPAFEDDTEGAGGEVLDITSGGDEGLLDFDIGGLDDADTITDSLAPPGEGGSETEAADGLDIDLGAAEGGDDFDLQVDEADTIGDSLEPPTLGDAAAPASDAALDLGIDGAPGSDDFDFDVTMDSRELNTTLDIVESEDDDGRLEITMSSPDDEVPVDGDISLQGSDLDDLALDDNGDDFDFALEGTTEMEAIASGDTLDMGNVNTAADAQDSTANDDASLDDLALQLDGAIDDAALDDLEIDGLDSPADAEHIDTVSLDGEQEGGSSEFDPDTTVAMPGSDDADEADTKLNLAKAYIELGDTDGARSILDEVCVEGNAAQQAEAQSLLSQLPA